MRTPAAHGVVFAPSEAVTGKALSGSHVVRHWQRKQSRVSGSMMFSPCRALVRIQGVPWTYFVSQISTSVGWFVMQVKLSLSAGIYDKFLRIVTEGIPDSLT